jgi:hypothetical protein
MTTPRGGPHPDARPDDEDAFIEELLDEALADYEGIVPAHVMQAMREELGDTLAATASGRRLLRQMRPDPMVNASGDVARSPDAAQADEADKKASG